MVFAMEESAGEICRNALSVGLDLQGHVEAELLRIDASRPSFYGLEMHLARIMRDIDAFKPAVVVIDPISAFRGPNSEVHSILLRKIDLLKGRDITAMFTSLRSGGSLLEGTDQGLSSIMDAWIRLQDVEANGERSRLLYIIKVRGMSHSNQVREYRISAGGIELIEPYVGPEGVLTGTARLIQEAREQAEADRRAKENDRRKRQIDRRRTALQRQIADLQAALDADEEEQKILIQEADASESDLTHNRAIVADRRGAAE